MPKNGQVAVLKCSPKWRTMRKNFKTSELKLKFIPTGWKWEAMAHKTPFKRCSLKIEILTLFKDFYFFLFKPDNLG